MIELGLLGLLSEQDLHGYELKKQLGDLLGSWSTLSFGSLYPALNRLEKAGLVHAVDDSAPVEPVAPMTGALSGELAAFRNRLGPAKAKVRGPGRRGKKVYGITDLGRARLDDLLRAPGPDDERTFALRVAFCRHLPVDERLALFERRKAELTGLLAERRRATAGRRSDPYRRSLRERDTRALTADLDWLDELIDATRAATPTDDAPTGPARVAAAVASPSLTTLTSGAARSLAGSSKEGSP